MGTIIQARKEGTKIVSEVLTDYEEYLQLRGHLDNIRLFSENASQIQTNISQRGRNYATKYFLIPRQFRKGFKFNNITSCQKLDFDDKVVFVYVINKTATAPSKRELTLRKIEEKYNKNNYFKNF